MARASETAYSSLRADILDWTLEPGAILAEVDLSGRLGLSRTPVREALARLVADGLAEPLGGRGIVVSPLSRDDVMQLFELREPLEQQAAALAARRRDPRAFQELRGELADVTALVDTPDPARRDYYELVARFDRTVDRSVANPYLVAALANVRTRVSRIRRYSHDQPERLVEAAREHLLVVDAILAEDAQLAADATRVHLHRSLRSILDSLAATAPADIPSSRERNPR